MSIQKNKEKIELNYYLDNSGTFQLLVTDIDGVEQERKNVALKKGKSNLTILMPINGVYFVTLTNGFSSVTEIVTQTEGVPASNTAAVFDKIILH